MLDIWIGALEQFSINESNQSERSRGLHCGKDELIKALSKKRDYEFRDELLEDKICTLVATAPTGSMLEIPHQNSARHLSKVDSDLVISMEGSKSNVPEYKQISSDTLTNRINLHSNTSSYDIYLWLFNQNCIFCSTCEVGHLHILYFLFRPSG